VGQKTKSVTPEVVVKLDRPLTVAVEGVFPCLGQWRSPQHLPKASKVAVVEEAILHPHQ
jgi:hypothetical protein